jgi:nucleotide-binding universal stress UspA family protein
MFKHLLVPLDGSRLAETALPAAAYLARTLGAWVTLVHVIERDAPQEVHGERHLAEPDEACAYLEEVANRAFPAEVRVERHVHSSEVSDVARSIVEHVDELGRPDLIVMCTHGHGGLRTWLLGSIAQQVIAIGATPVLLIRPDGTGAAPAFTCRRLLVPLDGNPDHEQGLPVAVSLARACGAGLHLVMVVHTLRTLPGQQAAAARLLPAAASALLDISEDGAEEHLHGYVARLQTTGLPVTAEVCRGDPATNIVRTARRVSADVVVLGTHGKAGMDAFWSGSVAPQVVSRSHVPLLLVPVRETGRADQGERRLPGIGPAG